MDFKSAVFLKYIHMYVFFFTLVFFNVNSVFIGLIDLNTLDSGVYLFHYW